MSTGIITLFTGAFIYYSMKLTDIPHRVHFVGVGGIGMSALAQHLHKLGYRVTGSDRQANAQTELLHSQGVSVTIGHSAEALPDTQLVVRTSAVHVDNPEIVEANRRNLPVALREEVLGAIFNSFPTRIAVCGTHGKTTVTAMLHHVLTAANISHAAFIGGAYHGSNYYYGKDIVVAEACEYNRSFLNLRPTITVILNAEFDHPDCYKNLADVRIAFKAFAQNTDKNGVVVLPQSLQKLCRRRRCAFFDNGEASDVRLINGRPNFSITQDDMTVYAQLNVVGAHNARNALAVTAVARELGLSLLQTVQALTSFDGVDRRWTEKHGVCRIICDYAHHPTEIACSVSAARSVSKGKVICVFQPHTFSRTKAFFKQFATCFAQADEVAYLPIYSAREQPEKGVTSLNLSNKAKQLGINATYVDSFDEAFAFARNRAQAGDVLLILGAGDVVELADRF